MGWGRYLLLGDLGQQLDLSDQKAEIDQLRDALAQSRSEAQGPSQSLRELQAENDEMRLYLAVVIRLLAAKGVLTKEEIARMVDSLDAEDGRRDGKYQGPLG
jgi:hypothetical protein